MSDKIAGIMSVEEYKEILKRIEKENEAIDENQGSMVVYEVFKGLVMLGMSYDDALEEVMKLLKRGKELQNE